MTRKLQRWASLALGLCLLTLVPACSTNPAGRTAFTGLMSSSEEARLGAEEHPKIVAEFGGEYDDPKVRDYVKSIGQRLVPNTERANQSWTFTVLNSDIANAFAIPGGYVYITTGLMALANNEAELAGVMGHEMGHVTARHTAERYSQTVATSLALNILGVATRGVGQELAQFGAGAMLAGFSRGQESEADSLGVRYMAQTGYDPVAMASFLRTLEGYSNLEALLAGRNEGDRFSLFATHPRTADRVVAAAEQARKQIPPTEEPRVGEADYLAHLDGLSYGGDKENGFIRNRTFMHPRLRFKFEVPSGFRLFNSATQVVGIGPDKARVIFDRARNATPAPVGQYLKDTWAPGLSLSQVESININGLDSATASARVNSSTGPLDLRLVAMRLTPQIIYRFVFVSPPSLTASLQEDFRRATYSFRMMSPEEAAKAEPLRIRLRLVEPGDTVESLAKQMPFDDHQVERFLALNGMRAGQPLKVNHLVKIAAD
ncbi:MAG: M48 family metalloprotease [Alphaproteobacteria bacterium]